MNEIKTCQFEKTKLLILKTVAVKNCLNLQEAIIIALNVCFTFLWKKYDLPSWFQVYMACVVETDNFTILYFLPYYLVKVAIFNRKKSQLIPGGALVQLIPSQNIFQFSYLLFLQTTICRSEFVFFII